MKKIPLTLALLASLAMVAPCFAQAAPPPKAPPVDERLTALETRLAALEAKCGTCPCCSQVTPTVGASTSYVQHADGSVWARTCGPDGCSERLYQSAYNQTGPFPFLGGSGSCGPGGCGGGGGPMMGGGCASGNCGGGGCASGNCGGGGRGRRGRR